MRARVPTQPCRVTVKSETETHVLDARYVPGSAGAVVVAPPHPLFGGTFENPIVVAALAGFQEASVATLTFNYRGVEASEGVATGSLQASVADYDAALADLSARTPGPYYAAGYSFGAGTALLAVRDDPRVMGAVLIAPPVGLLHAEDLRAFHGRLFVLVGDDDEYAPIGELSAILAARSDATLTVLPGVDHFFHFGGFSEIAPLVTERIRSWL